MKQCKGGRKVKLLPGHDVNKRISFLGTFILNCTVDTGRRHAPGPLKAMGNIDEVAKGKKGENIADNKWLFFIF